MEKTMALDGIVIANITNELNKILTGSRITKIAQPEKDELLLTIKHSKEGSDGKTIRSNHRTIKLLRCRRPPFVWFCASI